MSKNVWRKRLLEQISDVVESSSINKRARTGEHGHFICPKCQIDKLIPCANGVTCASCSLTIELECGDLTVASMQRMLDMARKDHSACNPDGRVSVMTMADDTVFLTWTCDHCHQLEILL